MKAPTVATLYPRHGDFAATSGCRARVLGNA